MPLTAATASENFSPAAPWDEIAHVVRCICLLRVTGRSLDAARLQSTELSRLLTARPPSPHPDACLHALFAEEERRVAEARILAELLAPMLLEQLRPALASEPASAHSAAPSHTHPPEPVPFVAEPASPHSPTTTPHAAPAERPVRSAAPDIADFIDEMLTQQRPAPRPVRRAS